MLAGLSLKIMQILEMEATETTLVSANSLIQKGAIEFREL